MRDMICTTYHGSKKKEKPKFLLLSKFLVKIINAQGIRTMFYYLIKVTTSFTNVNVVGPSYQKGHLLLDYSKPQMALTQEPTKK